MLQGLVDHLWQSCCIGGVACAFSLMTQNNTAVMRLWLLRIALLKLVLPFSLLYAFGAWLGYPATHSSEPVPPVLVATLEAWAPYVSPARHFGLTGLLAVMCLLPVLVVAGIQGWLFVRGLRLERAFADEESRRRKANVDDVRPSIGFMRAALFTATALVFVSAPLVTGAVADRQWRLEMLAANSDVLRDAQATFRKAAPGMGERARVIADNKGVLVRNASIRNLVAIAYGVNPYYVWSEQMYTVDESGDAWLSSPRYDIRVDAPILEPQYFDAYALREPVSRLLADSFSLQIKVNAKCQQSCADAEPSPTILQLNYFLWALESGDRATLEEYARENVDPDYGDSAHIDQALSLQKEFGGFDIVESTEPAPNQLKGWLRAKTSDAVVAFTFSVEPDPPHKLASFELDWNASPPKYLPRR